MNDITIIGAGVIGASIARELSKYNLKICVLEKNNDIADGTSKANSGIVHAGFDAKPNTLKGKLNALGNLMFDQLSKELDFPFKRNGSFVLCFNKEDIHILESLKMQGENNNVPNLKILNKDEILALEPNVSKDVVAALYAPTGGIVCPYEYTIALCENAYENGVEFHLSTEVSNIKKDNGTFIIETNKGIFHSKIVINAAGVNADKINNYISKDIIKIIGRKGEYCLFDKIAGKSISHTIFQLPTKLGKGILVTPTVDGNLLVGPNAVNIEDKDDLGTTKNGIDEILSKGSSSIEHLPYNRIITSFSGIRAHSTKDDFILGESSDVENFINAAGIESPGLSSAPAIGVMIKDIVVNKLKPSLKENFKKIRHAIPRFRDLNENERIELINKNPKYGKVICRCEVITEGEIIDSIRRPLGATSLDGVKKRTRAGMGGCQGGFCSASILSILSDELNIPLTDVLKSSENSNLLIGKVKEI